MTDPRWTDGTRDLVAQLLYVEVGDYDEENWLNEPERRRTYYRGKADLFLAALADAGLLMEPGVTSRVEWFVEVDRGSGYTPSPHPLAPYIMHTAEELHRYRQGIVKSTRVMTRTVHEDPWREVIDGT